MFGPDGDTDAIFCRTGCDTFFVSELLMRCRPRMYSEGLGVADTVYKVSVNGIETNIYIYI